MSDARGSAESPKSRSPGQDERPDATRGLYGISVAAELVGSAPQNLRLYETRGLINPGRSQGGTRRYSDDDLVRLREIGRLLDDGLNLAGIAAVLALEAVNHELQTQLEQTRQRASAPHRRPADGGQPNPRSR
jgi:MerR family transcriptional regulator, heat shock protein HspR